MSESTREDTLVLTTETREKRRQYFALYWFIGPLTAALGSFPFWAPFVLCVEDPEQVQSLPLEVTLGFPALALGLFLLIALLVHWQPRGTWRIGREGIAFHPLRGNPRCLHWQDVERVRWTWMEARFEGKGESIRVLWHVLREQQEEARERLREFLSPAFDLSLPPPAPVLSCEPSLRSTVARAAKLGGLAVLFVAVLMGPLFLLAMHPDSWLAKGWVLSCLLALLGLAAVLLRRDQQKREQLYPTWRVRRTQQITV